MSLVTLSETKTHLNIPLTTTTWDTELQGFIDAAQPVVEDVAGIVTSRTIVGEVQDGGSEKLVTRYAPIISVQSLVEYVGVSAFTLTNQPQGSTVDNYGYDITDALAGVITRRGASGNPLPFQGGTSGVVISYTAGIASLPANVRLGTLELIRHWWQRSQQGGRPSFTGTGEGAGYTSVGSYLVPYFVAELLAATPSATRRVPGIA